MLPREIALPLGALASFAASRFSVRAVGPARNLLQFFLLPFAVLVAVVARAPFPQLDAAGARDPRVALAALFAAIGLVEEATHRLLFYSPAVEVGTPTRASSASRRSSATRASTGATSCSGSRSSSSRSGTGRSVSSSRRGADRPAVRRPLLLLLAVELRRALRRRAVSSRAVAGDSCGPASWRRSRPCSSSPAGARGRDKSPTTSTQRVTSDRSRRIDLTAKVFRQHPLVGVGLGSQPRASQPSRRQGGPPTLFVSHTTPLTVAAELGIVGLALYLCAPRRRGLRSSASAPDAAPSASRSPRSSSRSSSTRSSTAASSRIRSPGSCSASPRASSRAAGRAAGETVSDRVDGARLGVLGVLGALIALNVRHLGSDPWPFRPAVGAPARPARPARARGRPRLGPRLRAHAGVLAGVLVVALAVAGWRRAPWQRGAGSSRCCVVVVALTLLVPAALLQVGLRRGDRAVVLHERLDLPDRARRQPRPPRPQPVRPRLRRLGARALLQPRRLDRREPTEPHRSRCATSRTSPARR